MTHPVGLPLWLARLEARHPRPIELGLERIGQVWAKLGRRPDFPIITVGGTNGKGSTCAFLEAMLSEAGYSVGLYTSPHLRHYNERLRIGRARVAEAAIVASLEAVEAARGDVPLTYFEQATLAAMWQLCAAEIDVAVLEVGLGGRLDAVNLFDADCAVVTSVDLDHMDYLGHDREAIGFEKAGIYRAGQPAICTDPVPPQSLLRHAGSIGAALLLLERNIRVERGVADWTCRIGDTVYPALPWPALHGDFQLLNGAAAIAALHAMRQRLPVPMRAIRLGLTRPSLAGRFHVIGRDPLRILDVAHNPQAARALASNLAILPRGGVRRAVFAMLRDKDMAGVIAALRQHVDVWYLAGLAGPRGTTADDLAACLEKAGIAGRRFDDVVQAWAAACQDAAPADTIIAFGSFHTVADVMALTPGIIDGE